MVINPLQVQILPVLVIINKSISDSSLVLFMAKEPLTATKRTKGITWRNLTIRLTFLLFWSDIFWRSILFLIILPLFFRKYKPFFWLINFANSWLFSKTSKTLFILSSWGRRPKDLWDSSLRSEWRCLIKYLKTSKPLKGLSNTS